MSVGSIGSLPDPGFYNSPSTLPAGLSGGSAGTSAISRAASATSASAATAPAVSPYQTAYANLQEQDAAELIGVSTGSADAAQANVSNVLAQAAQLQAQQLATQQAAAARASAAAPSIANVSVPSLTSLIQQSDTNAGNDLANGTLGSSVNTVA
jgi:hypothetical protein